MLDSELAVFLKCCKVFHYIRVMQYFSSLFILEKVLKEENQLLNCLNPNTSYILYIDFEAAEIFGLV